MKKTKSNRSLIQTVLVIALFFLIVGGSFAQPGLPPRVITLQATQSIDFGKFVVIGDGTITMDWQGNLSSTGGVYLVPGSFAQPAIFEIKLCEGRSVTMTFNATAILTNGTGGSLTLNIGPTEKGGNGDSFETIGDCNFITPLRVGGNINVPAGTPSGIYIGTFEITLEQK